MPAPPENNPAVPPSTLDERTPPFNLPEEEQLTPGWTWICDPRGLYLECSPEVERYLGVLPASFSGQHLDQYRLMPASAALVKNALERSEFPSQVEVHFLGTKGQPVRAILYVIGWRSEVDHQGIYGFVNILASEEIDSQFVTDLEDYDYAVASFSGVGTQLPAQDPVTADFESTTLGEIVTEEGNDVRQAPPTQPAASSDFDAASSRFTRASNEIIQLLENLRDTKSEIRAAPKKRISTRRDLQVKEDETGVLEFSGTLFGRKVVKKQDVTVLIIEHRLEWGDKLSLTREEQEYIEKNRYRNPGLAGRLQLRLAPKELLRCSKQWLAVNLVVEKDRSEQLILCYGTDAEQALDFSMDDFLAQPERLFAELNLAVRQPRRLFSQLQLGTDYLIERR